jgi:hypothetical protein
LFEIYYGTRKIIRPYWVLILQAVDKLIFTMSENLKWLDPVVRSPNGVAEIIVKFILKKVGFFNFSIFQVEDDKILDISS